MCKSIVWRLFVGSEVFSAFRRKKWMRRCVSWRRDIRVRRTWQSRGRNWKVPPELEGKWDSFCWHQLLQRWSRKTDMFCLDFLNEQRRPYGPAQHLRIAAGDPRKGLPSTWISVASPRRWCRFWAWLTRLQALFCWRSAVGFGLTTKTAQDHQAKSNAPCWWAAYCGLPFAFLATFLDAPNFHPVFKAVAYGYRWHQAAMQEATVHRSVVESPVYCGKFSEAQTVAKWPRYRGFHCKFRCSYLWDAGDTKSLKPVFCFPRDSSRCQVNQLTGKARISDVIRSRFNAWKPDKS